MHRNADRSCLIGNGAPGRAEAMFRQAVLLGVFQKNGALVMFVPAFSFSVMSAAFVPLQAKPLPFSAEAQVLP